MRFYNHKYRFLGLLVLFLFFLNLSQIDFDFQNNSNSEGNSIIKEPLQPLQPLLQSPKNETYSENINLPITLDIDTYYVIENSDDKTYYIQVYLDAGKIYAVTRENSWVDFYLYSDSNYSQEIRTMYDSFVNEIAFAPEVSNFYYIKCICSSSFQQYFGIWEATDFTNNDISEGIDLTLKDPDWGKGVVYFEIEAFTNPCEGWYDIDVNTPDMHSRYVAISTSSGEAFNTNEMLTNVNEFQTEVCNIQGGASYIMIHSDTGLFQITTPGSPTSGSSNLTFLWVILGILGFGICIGILKFSTSSRSSSSSSSTSNSRSKSYPVKRSTNYGQMETPARSSQNLSSSRNFSSNSSVSKKNVDLQEKTIQLKRLKGIITLENKIDLIEAAKILNTSKSEIKGLLYELAADQKIGGNFDGDVFYINKGVNTFLENLDGLFEKWDGQEKSKKYKI